MAVDVHRFGMFELDLARVELRRGGERVDATPQTLKLLAYLIDNRDRAVSRDDLFGQLWPGVFVSDGALSNAIYEARRVVDDDGDRQQVIRTVRGHGFRFVAALRPRAEGDSASTEPGGPLVPPFVGREAVLGRLDAALAQARAGRGRLVLLEGEAGMGKTRTTQQFAARVGGAQVHVSHCYEGSGAPPFWPWMQVLREQLERCDPAAVRRAVGSGAGQLAELVPSLRERLSDGEELPPLGAAEARFQLFEAVATWLRASARRAPLVIVLDDLHWADQASLLLLEFLAVATAAARIVIVGTLRAEEVPEAAPLTATLAALARHAHHERLVLDGLERSEVEALLTQTMGQRPSPELLGAVIEKSEGNPLFVKELAPLLEAAAADGASAAAGRLGRVVPGAVKELITRRVAPLAPATQQMLQVAAVIGREFGREVLERLWRAPEVLLDALDEAVGARVVSELPGVPGRFRFAHGLFQEALYERVGSRRRAELHRQVGETLETLVAADADAHIAELAHHWWAALAGGADPLRAVTYSLRAGDRAAALLAYEEAVVHYRRAAETAESHLRDDPRRRAEVSLTLGAAQTRAGDGAAARTSFERGAALGRELDDAELLACAALGYADAGFEMARSNTMDFERPLEERAIALLEEALGRLDEADCSPLRVRLLGRLARELRQPAQRARRLALSESALHGAQRLGDPDCLAETVTVRREVLCEPENLHERFALANEIVRLAEQSGNRELSLAGRRWRLVDLLELGEVDQVRVEIELCEHFAAELRQPRHAYSVAMLRAALTLLEGRHDEADAAIERALDIGRRVNGAVAETVYTMQVTALRRQQGRLAEILPQAQALVAARPSVSARIALSYIYAELGHREAAARELELLGAADFADFARDRMWLIGLAVLADVCAQIGDRRRGALLYALLAPYAHHELVGGEGAIAFGSVSAQLGQLATLLEHWSEAEAYLERCLASNTRLGAPAYRGQIHRLYAELLLARGWPGDRPRAEDCIAEGLAVAERFQMAGLRERLLSLRDGRTPMAGGHG